MAHLLLLLLVGLTLLSSPAIADTWASLGTISAEPTAGRICSGDTNGQDILCASPFPSVDASGNFNIGIGAGHLNFGGTLGSSGYGIRDNAGAIEFKNSGGAWTGLTALSQWTTSGSDIYYTIGAVGIGTTTMTGALNVQKNSAITNSAVYGIHLTGAQTTANTSTYYGVAAVPTYSGTGTLASLVTVFAQPQNTNSGTVTAMYGVRAIPTQAGTGPVTSAYALYGRVDNTNATGTITNGYGLYLDTPTTTGTVTNKWGVYQVDGNSKNYFAGSVGIGTTGSTRALDVSGYWGAKLKSVYGSLIVSDGQVPDGTGEHFSFFQDSYFDLAGGNTYKQSNALFWGGTTATTVINNPGLYSRVRIIPDTFTAASAQTITTAATLSIKNAPANGTNVTITNPLAVYVQAGNSSFGGSVGVGTTGPSEKLDVSGNGKFTGSVQVSDSGTTCATAADLGKIRYNTATGKFQLCR